MDYTIIRNVKKALTWTVHLNGIHNEDRITATSTTWLNLMVPMMLCLLIQTRSQPQYVTGQSLTGIWAVRSLGIDPATGQEKFLKADGSGHSPGMRQIRFCRGYIT